VLRDLSWLGLAWDEGSINHHHFFRIAKLQNYNVNFLFYVQIEYAKVDIIERMQVLFKTEYKLINLQKHGQVYFAP